MKILTIFAFLSTFSTLFALPQRRIGVSDGNGTTPPELIVNYGYPVETHYVQTEDNYILTVYRIPHGVQTKKDDAPKTPVLLSHGLGSSAADYVSMGPTRSLPYLLADLGYDVWITNARGSSFSRNHTTLNPEDPKDKKEFFDFSWHEIGYYDHPATIDYILDLTGEEKLQYIGHSQGCTSFLVMAATRPEYNDKIRLATLLAPAAIMAHHPILYELCLFINDIDFGLKLLQIYEMPFTKLIQQLAAEVCPIEDMRQLCSLIFGILGGGIDYEQIDWDNFSLLMANFPSTFAIKQLIHYGQEIKSKGFNYFDYGIDKNRVIYGQEIPPPYDLSKVSAPVAVYYGPNDRLAHFEDAKTLISLLPNAVKGYEVPYPAFNHLDFIIAKDVATLLYDEVIKVIQEY